TPIGKRLLLATTVIPGSTTVNELPTANRRDAVDAPPTDCSTASIGTPPRTSKPSPEIVGTPRSVAAPMVADVGDPVVVPFVGSSVEKVSVVLLALGCTHAA